MLDPKAAPARIGLYRVGKYLESELERRVITAPAGEPLHLLPEDHYLRPKEELPGCLDCGDEIVWDEAGKTPWSRRCQGCGAEYTLHPVSQPGGGAWPWQDGRMILLEDSEE